MQSALTTRPKVPSAFRSAAAIGLALEGVELTTRYDGLPVLKVDGRFMAGLAGHPSAEPDSMVVRAHVDDRTWLLEDAPETYYLTAYYRRHPVVLVRLSRIDRDALRDLLATSRRVTLQRAARSCRAHAAPELG